MLAGLGCVWLVACLTLNLPRLVLSVHVIRFKIGPAVVPTAVPRLGCTVRSSLCVVALVHLRLHGSMMRCALL